MVLNKSMRSLNRAISVIKSFSPSCLELSVSEIALKTGIPRPTAYRILATLSESGLLEQNEKTSKFQVGPALYVLGSLYLSTTDILIAAKPVMETLNDLTTETVNLTILDKGYVTLIMREEAKYAFRWAAHIGSSIPAYATSSGKALLSELAEEEIDRIYPEEKFQQLTKKTITTKAELKVELQNVKKEGVAFNREAAYKGIEGIGAPIRNNRGEIIAAMSIGVPIFRISQANRSRLATLVKMGSSLTSYRLGYHDVKNQIHSIEELCAYWEEKNKTI